MEQPIKISDILKLVRQWNKENKDKLSISTNMDGTLSTWCDGTLLSTWCTR